MFSCKLSSDVLPKILKHHLSCYCDLRFIFPISTFIRVEFLGTSKGLLEWLHFMMSIVQKRFDFYWLLMLKSGIESISSQITNWEMFCERPNQIRWYKLLTQHACDLQVKYCVSPSDSALLCLSTEACTRRKKRCPYSKQQIRELEREFLFNIYINKDRRMQLSHLLRLTDRCVHTSLNQLQCDSFQNTTLQINAFLLSPSLFLT